LIDKQTTGIKRAARRCALNPFFIPAKANPWSSQLVPPPNQFALKTTDSGFYQHWRRRKKKVSNFE